MRLDKIMLNCKQASELASRVMDAELTLGQRMSLKFHLMMCRGCTNFSRQLQFLRTAARRYGMREGMPRLSEEARQRIARAMREIQQNEGQND